MRILNLGLFTSLLLFTTTTMGDMKQIHHSVDKYSKVFNIDRKLILAIIQVESNFKVNSKSNTKDYGLMQLNHKSMNVFCNNKKRLISDIDYSIMCGVAFLSKIKKKYGRKEIYWWARYHSSTPIHRDRYIKKIQKVLWGVS